MPFGNTFIQIDSFNYKRNLRMIPGYINYYTTVYDY